MRNVVLRHQEVNIALNLGARAVNWTPFAVVSAGSFAKKLIGIETRDVVLGNQEVKIALNALNLRDDVSEHRSSLGILLCHGNSRETGEDSMTPILSKLARSINPC